MKKISKSALLDNYGIDLPEGKFSIYLEGDKYKIYSVKDDTEGCLLPATKWARDAEGNAVGLNSREAFRRLFAKIEAAVDNNEPISIEIL